MASSHPASALDFQRCSSLDLPYSLLRIASPLRSVTPHLHVQTLFKTHTTGTGFDHNSHYITTTSATYRLLIHIIEAFRPRMVHMRRPNRSFSISPVNTVMITCNYDKTLCLKVAEAYTYSKIHKSNRVILRSSPTQQWNRRCYIPMDKYICWSTFWGSLCL